MCDHIKQNLHLPIHIESNKKGRNSIQISSIMNTLNNTIYKDFSSFYHNFGDKLEENTYNKKRLPHYFRIFIIMDTDDCKTDEQRVNYINKEMFKGHWAYEYIVPIFNTPELETVLTKADIAFKKLKDERKKEYIKIFPTKTKYKQQNKDPIEIAEFMKKLSKNKNTNMELFIKYCLSIVVNK